MEWILSCMSSFVNHLLHWQPMATAIISCAFHLKRNMTWCLSMKFCFDSSFCNWIYHLISLSPFFALPSPPSTFCLPIEYTCCVIFFNQCRVNCLHIIWYWIKAVGKLPPLLCGRETGKKVTGSSTSVALCSMAMALYHTGTMVKWMNVALRALIVIS